MIAAQVHTLDDVMAMTTLEATGLTAVRDPRSALACHCTCHLRRFGHPVDAYHDAGATCSCQLTDEQRRAARDEWLSELDRRLAAGRGDVLAVRTRRAREEATAMARERGLSITIESQLVPLVISGSLGETAFWFRERRGSWRLHIDGPHGTQIASGVSDPTPQDAVELIWDRVDRHRRSRECQHETAAPTDVFCRRCGQRHRPQ